MRVRATGVTTANDRQAIVTLAEIVVDTVALETTL